jgi:hypothetical protein
MASLPCRIALFALSFIAAGAITTVGVAWLCARFAPVELQYSKFDGSQLWPAGTVGGGERPISEVRFEAFGAVYMVWWDSSFSVTDMSAGWPWRAQRARMTNRRTMGGQLYDFRHDGIMELSEAVVQRSGAHTRRCLPWKPIAGPFLLDTFFYASIWSLIPVSGWLVRYHRDRRGLCVRCQYDRRGLAADVRCPECGDLPRVRR